LPEALVCVNTSLNSTEDVYRELKACPEIKEVFKVQGIYDIIARVKGDNFDDLVSIVNRRIKRLSQVQTILSMMIIEPKKPIRNEMFLQV
jgi:DNA-binding Lrp family transcriptional regulator